MQENLSIQPSVLIFNSSRVNFKIKHAKFLKISYAKPHCKNINLYFKSYSCKSAL